MGDNDGSTTYESGDRPTISGGDDPVLGLEVAPYSGSPGPASDLLAALEELRTADVPGGPDGIDWDGLATLPIDYEPDTSGMKGTGLPDVEVSQIYNVQGTGTYDGISHAAPAAAAATLVALAAAGRDPANITIPTIGSKAQSDGSGTSGSGSPSSTGSGSESGSTGGTGDGDDAVVGRTGGSGVMVAQGAYCRVGRPLGRQPARLRARRGAEQRPKIHPADRWFREGNHAEIIHPDADGASGGGSAPGGRETASQSWGSWLYSGVAYAGKKMDQASGVAATFALTGKVVDMDSASGMEIAGAHGGHTDGASVVVDTAAFRICRLQEVRSGFKPRRLQGVTLSRRSALAPGKVERSLGGRRGRRSPLRPLPAVVVSSPAVCVGLTLGGIATAPLMGAIAYYNIQEASDFANGDIIGGIRRDGGC